jgi:hypothetical protein
MYLKILSYLFVLFVYSSSSQEQKCFDFLLLDGAEPILTYGMDTTNNWYAITEPFQNRYRLVVNGEEIEAMLNVTIPIFSQDGKRWASFAEDNSGWMLFTESDVYTFNATNVGDIAFSENSEVVAYSYFETNLEIIKLGDKQFSDYRKKKGLWLDHSGDKVAYIIQNANQEVLKVNGEQINSFDKVYPVGFWEDGDIIYVGMFGGYFQVYKGKDAISDTYSNIPEIKLNRKGNVLAYIARMMNERYVAKLVSDDYNEAIISERYDNVTNLTLHPTEAIMAYSAVLYNAFTINMNLTEYFSGEYNTIPEFTWNGEELYFLGCRINCFFSVNGQNTNTQVSLPVDKYYARKPNSDTFAYNTGSSLVVRYLSDGDMRSGMMTNETINPRYNRFEDRYETLGVINNRLYLLTCRD